MKGSPSSYRLKRNSNKSYPSSNFLKRKPCTFFIFTNISSWFIQSNYFNFYWLTWKILKVIFFMNIIHMQKMTGNECLRCNSTVRPRQEALQCDNCQKWSWSLLVVKYMKTCKLPVTDILRNIIGKCRHVLN
jgi:hypothetical protein